jgi:hypothetical protein
MLTEAPSSAPTPSGQSSFFSQLRDEYVLLKKEAVTSSPYLRALVILSVILSLAALTISINAHGRLEKTPVAGAPSITVALAEGKTAVPVTAPVSLKAQSTNGTSGSKLTYSWTFGDGATGTGAAVTHTYASYGYYVVKVTARDAQGRQASAQTTLNVLPPAPQAVIKATQDRAYSYMLSADGTGSKGAELRYFWDFGDGRVSDNGDERKVSHIYLSAGTYTLTLTVVDVSGQQSVATKQITVKKL